MTAEQGPPHSARAADDPYILLAEARSLSERGHPAALATWKRLESASEAAGTRLSEGERAELLDHRAMEWVRSEPSVGARMFTEAADLFTRAGLAGDAVACQARAVLATAFAGDRRHALLRIEPLCAQAMSLLQAGQATMRHATAVLLSRARIRAGMIREAEDERAAAAELDAELAEFIAFVEPYRDESVVLARTAEALESRGRLATQYSQTSDAAELLAEAVRRYHAAGRPWQAVEAELTLSRTLLADGRPTQAEAGLRDILANPRRGETLGPRDVSRLHLSLGDVLTELCRVGDAAEAFGEAARQAEAAGERPSMGAYARLRQGGGLLEGERHDEAAAVLADVLPDLLSGHGHAHGDVVRARSWLAQAYAGTGEHGAAAAQFKQAAETAESQYDQAALTQLAAGALSDAGRGREAGDAFEHAERTWRELGEVWGALECLRSRAMAAMASADRPQAVELLGAAVREVESLLAEERDEERRGRLRVELGRTYRATAQLLLWAASGPPDERLGTEREAADRLGYEQAAAFTEHAAMVFQQVDAAFHERTEALLAAASLELALGRGQRAAERARAVLDSYPPGAEDGEGIAASRRHEAELLLERAEWSGERGTPSL